MDRKHTSAATFVGKVVSLFAVFGLALGAAPAHAAEVAPQIFMQQILTLSQSSDGAYDVSCGVTNATDGSFVCGPNVSGRIVGVTNEFGAVVGHRVRITRRVSSTVVENYVGAIAYDDDNYGLWMTGELTITSQVRQCTFNGVCLQFIRTTGPLPFTGKSFYIGG